jgi:competence ComEA-like helix-hairpin-helix protein
MPTPSERKALAFLAIVALSGSAVRLVRAYAGVGGPAPDSVALDTQIDRVDSVRERRSRHSKAKTAVFMAPDTTKVDLDYATADEIEALPGIGPALARRVIANRDSSGAFGGLEALCSVSGIGKTLVERLRPLVTFTGAPRPLSDGCRDASKGHAKSRRAGASKPR